MDEFHLESVLLQPICIPVLPDDTGTIEPLDYYRTTNWTAQSVPLAAYPVKEYQSLQSKGAPVQVMRDILFARHISGYQRKVSPATPPQRKTLLMAESSRTTSGTVETAPGSTSRLTPYERPLLFQRSKTSGAFFTESFLSSTPLSASVDLRALASTPQPPSSERAQQECKQQ